jgi:CheY-like chemotaxis protein
MTDAPSPARPSTAAQRPHVLVVTDDGDLKDFLAEGLVLGGFWISSVASAFQALEVFRLRSFDLVLVDAALGGIGAIELVRRLRGRSDRVAGDEARTDVPLLFVAATSDEIDGQAAEAVGANGVLVAPLDLEHLVPRLFRVIADWRSIHPERPWADQVAQLRSDGV